ncbi:DUF305 domain-containing protein [Acrocarpospora phusangensis]|uniref:DUF305 domain-containing protein n=1 Tax=Acrocarpospora phusangensis TaxID=1070424 RepID=A0A919QH44_9ACTN|nr:DUF305 domain-containing protein [Acrocarpospora phusangensis]GIH27463.1 DUF305 domain-containing protein [Acrocarpospora phusangensis]
MRLPVVATSALACLLVTACSGARAAAPPPAPPTAVQSAVSAEPGSYNATDVAWLQLVIPMTEQALDLMDTTATKTSNPRVVQLAADIAADHRTQLTQLRDLLRRSGNGETDIHDGHDLPGIVTPDDLLLVTKTRGPAFDRLFAQHIGDYLRQSVLVAKGEQDSGADPATKSFAASLSAARKAQLARLTGNGPA